MIVAVLILQGCTEPPSSRQPSSADRVGPASIYVFAPDSQDFLSAPQPIPLDATLPTEDALAALGDHLSRTYFRSDNGHRESAIRFEVVGVHRIPVDQRYYRLAVINMIDPQMKARQNYFQGSAGGLTTYYMLSATFLQPQRDPPLVDGLILLYNGEEFPETDHINLRGIVAAQTIRPLVTKILYRYRPEVSTEKG